MQAKSLKASLQRQESDQKVKQTTKRIATSVSVMHRIQQEEQVCRLSLLLVLLLSPLQLIEKPL